MHKHDMNHQQNLQKVTGLARVKSPAQKSPGFIAGLFWAFSNEIWKSPGFFKIFGKMRLNSLLTEIFQGIFLE